MATTFKYDLNFTLIKLEMKSRSLTNIIKKQCLKNMQKMQSECNGIVKDNQYLLQPEFNENAVRK